ncbi:sensor histidine kinase [Agrobacterium sp. S2]|nr:sensor histidine kinase [Agrobacterium sp. S2]
MARNGEVVGMISTHLPRRNVPADASYRFFDILPGLASDFIVQTRAEAAARKSKERFQQFAKASVSAFGSETLTHQANAGGLLRGVLESETGAQTHSENQYELTEAHLMPSPKAVEVLTVALHELSTNALKYGALSVSGGRIKLTWRTFEKRDKGWIAVAWGGGSGDIAGTAQGARLRFGVDRDNDSLRVACDGQNDQRAERCPLPH